MTSRYEHFYKNHPQPKKIKVYNSTAFGPNNPDPTPFLEFDPPGEEDFMRYRMNRVWSKDPANLSVDYIKADAPFKVSTSGLAGSLLYQIETRAGQGGMFELPRQEKVIIEYNQNFITEAGTVPSPGITEPQDKWALSIIADDQDGRNSTIEQPLERHGIIATFEKLRDQNKDPVNFYDYGFEYEAPLDVKKVGDNAYGSIRVSEAEVKPVYNFYAKSYESILTNENPNLEPPETLLPNLYSFLTAIENEDNMITRLSNGQVDPTSIDTIFEKHITLNGLIKETRVATQVAYNAGGRSQTDIAEVSKGQYFDKYSYAWADYLKRVTTVNPPSSDILSDLKNKFKNQIIPTSNIQLFSDFNPIANRFPMYCELNFSTQKGNEIVDLFQDTQLMPNLIQSYVDKEIGPSEIMNFNFVTSGSLPFVPIADTYSDFSYIPVGDTNPSIVPSGSLKCYEMTNWLDSLQNPSNIPNELEDGVILGKYDEGNQNARLNSLTRRIMQTVFLAKMRDAVQKNTRSWADIIGGEFNDGTNILTKEKKLAYHETLFYKVEKWSVKSDGTPDQNIQNFYFPNANDIDKHHFTDTQVKYGKNYIYRIYAMTLVFGTKYNYRLDAAPLGTPSTFETNYGIKDNQARICILTDSYVKLVEVPYYQKQIVMMDSPPVFPDVEFFTNRGVRDKIRFWLRGNTGEYKFEPVLIQDRDLGIMNSIRRAQELNQTEPVTFKSDDQARYFEVYRLDKKPNRYSDFKDNRIAYIDTNKNLTKYCQSATSTEFVDTNFDVNKKYYYMFRVIDNHGHFSNPSPVYELEMVYDGYAPFLLSNVYMLDENAPPPTKPAKTFTKYIYIKPALPQRTIDEVVSGLKDENGNVLVNNTNGLSNKFPNGQGITLGTREQSLWDKNLKIRIISKKTGKKIDLNLKFDKKHVELVETEENKIC